MQGKACGWFLKSAGALLAATGLATVLSGFGTGGILDLHDPILGVAFGKLLPAVGVFEVLVGIICFSSRLSARLKLSLVAWIATMFLVYRVGLWCVGWHHPCGCMGSLAGVLHLSNQAGDRIIKGLLAYLLVGSCLLLLKGSQAGGAASVGSYVTDGTSKTA